MHEEKIKTGSPIIDNLLNGGLDKGILSTIYGPASCGKTTVCLMSAIETSKSGKKVFYVDSEGGFSVERFMQLNSDEKLLKNILIMKPLNFEEQTKTIETIKNNCNDKIGLVIIDSISMHYRVELSNSEEKKRVINELTLQLAWLIQTARKNNIPVLITNQVYADFENKDQIKMVGGDILKNTSKCLVELQKDDDYRKAIVTKHRSIREDKEIKFTIEEQGFEEYRSE